MIEKIKQFIVNWLKQNEIKPSKLSLTQTLFKYVVFLCIGIVSLDLIVPMILKWMVIKGEIDLVKLGLDPSKFFRIVPFEAYNFLNFFLATMAGIYGWRKQTDANVTIETTKKSEELPVSQVTQVTNQ
jgi:hypothetical protein